MCMYDNWEKNERKCGWIDENKKLTLNSESFIVLYLFPGCLYIYLLFFQSKCINCYFLFVFSIILSFFVSFYFHHVHHWTFSKQSNQKICDKIKLFSFEHFSPSMRTSFMQPKNVQLFGDEQSWKISKTFRMN